MGERGVPRRGARLGRRPRSRATARRLTGEWEQPHARPWSSAIRFETTAGPGVVQGQRRRHPARGRPGPAARPSGCRGWSPRCSRSTRDRGWSLCRDAGPMLREVRAGGRARGRPGSGVLARYAEAQLALSRAPRRSCSRPGSPRCRRATVPGLARHAARRAGRAAGRRGRARPPDRPRRLAAVLPALDDWCAELAASPVPGLRAARRPALGQRLLARVGATGPGSSTGATPPGAARSARCSTTMNSVAFHAGLYVEGRAGRRTRRCCGCATPTSSRSPAYAGRTDAGAATSTWRVVPGASGRRCPTGAALREPPVEAHAELGLPGARLAAGAARRQASSPRCAATGRRRGLTTQTFFLVS